MVQDTPRQLPRPPYWQTAERFSGGAPGGVPTEDPRFHEITGIRRPPIDIGRALNEQCNIPVRYYFVAGITEDGKEVTYAGPSKLPTGAIDDFFDMPKFKEWLQKCGATAVSPLAEDSDTGFSGYHRPPSISEFGGRRSFDRRRPQGPETYDEDTYYKTRKRPRANVYRREAENDEEPQVQVVMSKRGIKIGNHQEVWDICDQRFRNMQQTACKLIAKAWVKLVEPKKQSTHPYTGKDEKAPDWWPKAWGPTKEERVRHKEPDHLYKKERVHLLNHILRMIVLPNDKQHPDIQKLNLNVAKLEEATFEALSGFFADKDNPNNAKKKPYLKEIFKVVRFEERFKNGEIDGDTEVYVMADDKIPDSYQSDNEDSGSAEKDEEADPTSIQSSLSPQKTVAPHSGLMQVAPSEQSPGGNIQGGPYMGELPVRGPHYQPHIMPPDLGSGPHGFVEGGNMGVNNAPSLQPAGSMGLQEVIPDPHSQSRRPSLFSSPQDYGNPSAPGMYPAWQQATTAPGNSPMYAFTPQQPQPPQQGPFVQQQPMQIQNQQFMGQSFDSLPRGSYDPNQGDMFRPGNVGSATVPHSQTFPSYIPHDGRGGIKLETLGRNHLH